MESATQAIPSERVHDQISLNADHSGMVKFNNNFDGNYVSVVVRLRECVKNGLQVPDSLFL